MRSLFARFWLSYLAVIALTLAVAAAFSFALAVRRAEITDRFSPNTFVVGARAALASGGPQGLGRWLDVLAHGHPELQFYFVDSKGRELLNRPIEGRRLPSAQGAATPILRSRDGTIYRMIVRRTRNIVFDLRDISFEPAVLLVAAVTVGGVGSAWLARYLTLPVEALRLSVRTVAAGDLQAQVEPTLAMRSDALGSLARDFDQMVANLRALIASKEDLLRDISHELRSPLARLRVAASLARQEAGAGSEKEFDRIEREVERIDRMVGEILRFSRLSEGTPKLASKAVDLTELLEETVEDARIEAGAAGKRLKFVPSCDANVQGDDATLRSALENVLRNAIAFAPKDSEIDISLALKGNLARIEVTDRGPGISGTDAERIFEPFYRGENSNGAGLGLAIAKRAILLHGGTISAENQREGGLSVHIELPVA